MAASFHTTPGGQDDTTWHIEAEERSSYGGLRRGTLVANIPSEEAAQSLLAKMGRTTGPLDCYTGPIWYGFHYQQVVAYVAPGRVAVWDDLAVYPGDTIVAAWTEAANK